MKSDATLGLAIILSLLCALGCDETNKYFVGAPPTTTPPSSTSILSVVGTLGVRTDITSPATIAATAGDGGLASAATLRYPGGTAFDTSGNLYVADGSNRVIRRVDASTGIIDTVAGSLGVKATGIGDCGDGGLASAALFMLPMDVKFDSAGNIYVADYSAHAIRKIDTSGVITTILGTYGSSGTSLNPPYTNPPYPPGFDVNTDGIVASTAPISYPWAIYVDSADQLYVAAAGNNTVLRVDTTLATPLVYLVAGVPGGPVVVPGSGDGSLATVAYLESPMAVAKDGAGNIYIADRYHNVVRMVDASTKIISTVVGNQYRSEGMAAPTWAPTNMFSSGYNVPATDSSVFLSHPFGLVVDASGNLYISEEENHAIRKVDANTQLISTIAGLWRPTISPSDAGEGGPPTSATLAWPTYLTLGPNGELYVTDTQNWVIRRIIQ